MLIKPLISEKSTLEIKKRNCYTFIASPFYNKTQFKIELKKIYNIKIDYINSMSYTPKVRNNRNKKHFLKKKRGNMKKFIVKLKGDSKIMFDNIDSNKNIKENTITDSKKYIYENTNNKNIGNIKK